MPRARDLFGRFAQPRALTAGAAEAIGGLSGGRPGYDSTGYITFNGAAKFGGVAKFGTGGWMKFDGTDTFDSKDVFATMTDQPQTGFFNGRSRFDRHIVFAEE